MAGAVARTDYRVSGGGSADFSGRRNSVDSWEVLADGSCVVEGGAGLQPGTLLVDGGERRVGDGGV